MRPFKGPHDSGVVQFTSSTTWTVPDGVTSICVVCIGAGGASVAGPSCGGGGGALAYKNSISVTPGTNYTVTVGRSTNTSDTSFAVQGGSTLVLAKRGADGTASTPGAGGAAASCIGDAAFSGGAGGRPGLTLGYYYGGGGGGAAGYAGNGGRGGSGGSGTAGSGGGGGGGAGYPTSYDDYPGAGGGGVRPLGQGSNGAAGVANISSSSDGLGKGGSSGNNGAYPNGGLYGGGAGGLAGVGSFTEPGSGGNGVVRVIWGPNRSFPSTNTGGV